MKLDKIIYNVVTQEKAVRLSNGLAMRFQDGVLSLSRKNSRPSEQEIATVLDHARQSLPPFRVTGQFHLEKDGHGIVRFVLLEDTE